MTTGIYKLNFKGTDKVYIGKGKDIEHRWANHQFKFLQGTHSKKMQDAYIKYGMPTIEILLECEYDEINDNENTAIEIFNSVENGFNTLATAEDTPDGSSTPGELHGMSKTSNELVLKAFEMLLNPDNTLKYIAESLSISYRVVAHISNGESHTWLNKLHPEKYSILMSMKGTRHSISNSAKSRGVTYGTIVSPEGIEYIVDHLTNFCKEHSLDASTLSKVLKGKIKHHKKWTLK